LDYYKTRDTTTTDVGDDASRGDDRFDVDSLPSRERWLPLLVGAMGIAVGIATDDRLLLAVFVAYLIFFLSPFGGRLAAKVRNARAKDRGARD